MRSLYSFMNLFYSFFISPFFSLVQGKKHFHLKEFFHFFSDLQCTLIFCSRGLKKKKNLFFTEPLILISNKTTPVLLLTSFKEFYPDFFYREFVIKILTVE